MHRSSIRSIGLWAGVSLVPMLSVGTVGHARGWRVGDLAIVGGTIIDVAHEGKTSDDRQNRWLLIRKGRFSQMGRGRLPAGVRVIDARGKFIVPGLIDGFGSLRSQGFADAYLFEGVTTVFVNHAPAGFDGEARVAEVRGGPRIVRGETIAVGLSDAIDPVTITKKVNSSVGVGTRAFAVGTDIASAPLRQLVDVASTRGVRVIGMFARTSYPDALAAGATILLRSDHYQTVFASPDLLLSYAATPTGPSAGAAYRAACRLDPASPEVTRFARLLVSKRAALMPILSIEATADDVGAPNPWKSEAASFVEPSELDDPVDPVTGARPFLVAHADRMSMLQSCARNRQRIDASLHAQGVRYIAGSGAPAYGILPGAGLHQELLLLQQIGLTPREALAAATSGLADAFGWRDVGKIERGRFGDLLILDRDPRLDVTALEAINAVILAGKFIDRKELLARTSKVLGKPSEERKPAS